ncbi:antirestriction protein ArdA [Bernardetia sp.]|uniref:antirestriction protein ArdA n=1 Tax=Bernardetia sp. TaxID=1937974 RepID=UPI0025BBE4C0|nr:antirestriction protein ArdA [Bernardetia sp.]
MKIFVSDYGTYNEYGIIGKWFDLLGFDSAKEFVKSVFEYFKELDKKYPLLNGPIEEPMYQDFEGFPDNFYSESMGEKSLERLFDFAEFVRDKEQSDIDCFISVIEHFGCNEVANAIDIYENNYQGYYKEFSDFAHQHKENHFDCLFDENLIKAIEPFFDYKHYEHELRHSYTNIDGHVFLSH